MSKFKIKSLVPYEIMLSETGETLIESISMVRLIRYLKITEQMGVGRSPNVIFKEDTSERKKTWMRQLHMDTKMEYPPQCLSHK